MELKVNKESVTVNEVVYDASTEMPIECDVLLPDYCPDMMKILKCCATPVFTEQAVEGASLKVEGYVRITLYYLTDGMQIRCSEHRSPFSKALDLKTAPQDAAIRVCGRVDYLNCRAVNQRRVDVRGAMTLTIRVIGSKEEQLVSGGDGGGIQLRRNTMNTTTLAGSAQRSFTVREELELGHGKPAVGTILRRELAPVVIDSKVIANKVIMKGELMITMFYLSAEDETPAETQYNLPVSQIVDLAGVDEDCQCDVRLRVASADLQPKADLDGESTMLTVEVTLCAEVTAHRSSTLTAVSDAYSTAYESTFAERPLAALRLLELVNDKHAYKEQMELPGDAVQVLHAWCEAQFTGVKLEEDAVTLQGKLNLCMFALDREGAPAYFEKTEELEHAVALAAPADSLIADVMMQPLSCEFTPAGDGRVEVRCEIGIQGALYTMLRCNVMSELSVDETRPQAQDGAVALTIYFAQPGESVWDIAKRYHTSMEAVKEENSLEKDQLPERTTLLIPLVG